MIFSASSVTGAGISLKNFESQSEVDEKKRKRQEEWEKVRKPEDPEGTQVIVAQILSYCLMFFI